MGAVVEKDSLARKNTPIFRGCVRYFPDALAAVARLSYKGNEKHNPGQEMHHARGKSNDHGDCILRHQIEFDQIDPETDEFHAVAVAWRALAQLQELIERVQGLPMAPGARAAVIIPDESTPAVALVPALDRAEVERRGVEVAKAYRP